MPHIAEHTSQNAEIDCEIQERERSFAPAGKRRPSVHRKTSARNDKR
jgi:hypothetical protein